MLPSRKDVRMPGYDYAQSGFYFVTVCTENKKHIFGHISDGKMTLNDTGMLIDNQWNVLINSYDIRLDEYIIMPNHFHGIIIIKAKSTTKTIGEIVGAFKSKMTHAYIDGVKRNIYPPFDKRLFQRNYYEHIIRNEKDYLRIKKYIRDNPMMWEKDEDYTMP